MIFFILLVAAALLVGVALGVRFIENKLIFFPMKGEPVKPEPAPVHEDVAFEASDGIRLHGWFVPPTVMPASTPAVGSGRGVPVILLLHGNAGNIGHRWEKIRALGSVGCAVFAIDYRGYGRSGGSPTEAGVYRDVDGACAYLAGRGTPTTSIIVYGESIGGALAVDLAARKTVKALIVENTFTSIADIAKRTFPLIPAVALASRMDSLSKIGKVGSPKLVIHSIDDEIVPFEMGKRLFDSAVEPKRFLQLRGGHNTAFSDDNLNYRGGLTGFLAELAD